jgi:hypothetical protein
LKSKLDKIWVGIVIGLLGVVVGFFVFGFYWITANSSTMGYFIDTVFLGTGFFQDKIVTVSVLFDVILFFVFMQMKYYNLCKGLLGVVIVAVPVVAILSWGDDGYGMLPFELEHYIKQYLVG